MSQRTEQCVANRLQELEQASVIVRAHVCKHVYPSESRTAWGCPDVQMFPKFLTSLKILITILPVLCVLENPVMWTKTGASLALLQDLWVQKELVLWVQKELWYCCPSYQHLYGASNSLHLLFGEGLPSHTHAMHFPPDLSENMGLFWGLQKDLFCLFTLQLLDLSIHTFGHVEN